MAWEFFYGPRSKYYVLLTGTDFICVFICLQFLNIPFVLGILMFTNYVPICVNDIFQVPIDFVIVGIMCTS